MKSFSDIAEHMEGKPTFKSAKKAKALESLGKRIIHFEIGDPEFATPPNIIEAAYGAMKSGQTHYADSMGLPDLRKAIQTYNQASRGFKPNIDQVLVTPGANIILYLAILSLVNPGEEVIIPDPGFATFHQIIKLCKAKTVRVPLRGKNNFSMSAQDLEKAITKKTQLIVVNSPSNPTGAIMQKQELDELYRVAEKHHVYLLLDEIYSRIINGQHAFYSPSANDKCLHSCIVVNGFSKAFAMTGWRLGFAIGPKNVIEKMGMLGETLYSCVPPFIQYAGIAALQGDQSKVNAMMAQDQKKRNLLIEGLNAIPRISCLKNEGAFYIFANIKKTGMSSQQFSDVMLKKAGVALLPGTDFGKHGEGYVRIAYAAVNIDTIKKGLANMEKALKNL